MFRTAAERSAVAAQVCPRVRGAGGLRRVPGGGGGPLRPGSLRTGPEPDQAATAVTVTVQTTVTPRSGLYSLNSLQFTYRRTA